MMANKTEANVAKQAHGFIVVPRNEAGWLDLDNCHCHRTLKAAMKAARKQDRREYEEGVRTPPAMIFAAVA